MLPDAFHTTHIHAVRLAPEALAFIMAMHANAELMATMGGVRDAEGSQRYVDDNLEHWRRHGFGIYILRDAATGAAIGRAGLKAVSADGRAGVELAYAFVPAAWGKGFAPEIGRALIALGFEHLRADAFDAVTLRSNAASQRVLEKIGLRYAGLTRDTSEPKARYQIRRADWMTDAGR